MKLNLKNISHQQVLVASVLLACGVLGGVLGWVNISNSLNLRQQSDQQKPAEPQGAFVLRPTPLEKTETSEAAPVADPSELQIWEVAARQALPPRKEPLTPPRWRIVGVTAVGDEKSVLLLFANQPATEIRKIGDKLPGGAKIIQISQDHLQVSLNGQLMKLSLRKQ